MIFKKLNLEFYSFTEENIGDMKNLLNKGMKKKRDIRKAKQNNVNESFLFNDALNESMLDPDTYAMAKPSTDNSNSMMLGHDMNRKQDMRSMKSIDDGLSDETG